MNNTLVSIITGIIIIAGIWGLVFWQKNAVSVQPVTTGTGADLGGTGAGFESVNSTSDDDGTADQGKEKGRDESNNDSNDSAAGQGTGRTGEAQSGNAGTGGTAITSAQVAQHSTRESCWSIINGNVYDLTSWIPQHPGGEQAILQLCGTDGSAKFNGKHGGAVKQATVLAGFKIGIAAQ